MQIVEDIQDFLNEPVEDLESQLDIQDICILHSDRELELSESLRISQEGVIKGTPLLQDYLRLFSKIIPKEVIEPKLDSIFEEVTATKNLFDDPDKVQQELEGFVASYPHPKSLEKLIDFYILRNVEREKMLDAFHKLWGTYGIDNPKILSKYVPLFMKWDLSQWAESKFELSIIEKYLKSSPDDRIVVEKRLAEAYRRYSRPKTALKHYLQLLSEVKEKSEVIGEILDICIEEKLYGNAAELFEKYSDIIGSDASLRVKKVEVVFKTGNIEEVRKLLDGEWVTEKNLLEENPYLYVKVMVGLGRSEEADKKLNMVLNDALRSRSRKRLYEIGEVFYELDRVDEFRDKISRMRPDADSILRELDLRRPLRFL